MQIPETYTGFMPLIPLLFSNRKARLRWRSLGITLLLLYFLLFSIFSLFHVYAANELDSSHGCSIGEWIHLGQQAAAFFILVFVSVLLFKIHRNTAPLFVRTLFSSDRFERGPPLLPLLTR